MSDVGSFRQTFMWIKREIHGMFRTLVCSRKKITKRVFLHCTSRPRLLFLLLLKILILFLYLSVCFYFNNPHKRVLMKTTNHLKMKAGFISLCQQQILFALFWRQLNNFCFVKQPTLIIIHIRLFNRESDASFWHGFRQAMLLGNISISPQSWLKKAMLKK